MCIGVGDCDEECDRLKSTFNIKLSGNAQKKVSFYHAVPTEGTDAPFTQKRQPNIRLAVVVMHGILRDAEMQICRVIKALERHYGSLDEVLKHVVVVAPHLQTISVLGERIHALPEDELVWSSRRPDKDDEFGGYAIAEDPSDLRGWSVGAESSTDGHDKAVSSFEVMDQLVKGLTDHAIYPKMERVMMLGHGEGGSFVHRYALFTKVDQEIPSSATLSFHVANPSVLTYIDNNRPEQVKLHKQNADRNCDYNNNDTIAHYQWPQRELNPASDKDDYFGRDGCSVSANKYPYGLAGVLPKYVTNTWGKNNILGNIRKAYKKKEVVMYSGQADVCNRALHEALQCSPTDCVIPDMFLETTCPAMHQGPNRMARVLSYFQSANSTGPSHRLVRVDGVGHSACYMFQSRAMRLEMFGAESPSPPAPPPAEVEDVGFFFWTWKDLFSWLSFGTYSMAERPDSQPRVLSAPAAIFLLVVLVLTIVICCVVYRGFGKAVDEYVTKPRQRLGVPAATAISKMVAERKKNGYQTLAEDVYAALPPHDCLMELLPSTQSPAIRSPDPERPTCTHQRLRKFILEEASLPPRIRPRLSTPPTRYPIPQASHSCTGPSRAFDLTRAQVPANLGAYGIASGERVAAILPNGPEAVGATLALLSYVTVVPINIASVQEEIASQLEQCRCTAVVLLAGATVPNEVCLAAARKLELLVVEATPLPEAAGLFRIERALNCPRSAKEAPTPNRPEDPVLILLTSGTTGNKKVVPHLLKDCIAGATCLAVGQDLGPTDVCCNAMPLFHVGGIMRCVLSVTISGGSMVPMAYFDADWFLSCVTAHSVSWYYASPTIHQSILDAFHNKPVPHRLRLIANAAAPLPPALAVKMRETYSAPGRRCVLMPSYGMTECMPISAPPHDYNLERPGSSGRQLGPQLQIHTAEGEELPRGQVGHIALKGAPVMAGYEGGNGLDFVKGWFHTGDDGYIDEEGNLYVVARSKEAINRGGETIIPAEVEAALLTHPAIKSICCFATPHASLQETVGCVVVPAFGYSRITLSQLVKHASLYLHSSKWPAVLVYGEAMPLNATGKLVRVKLAERMSITAVDDETPEAERVYEMLGPPSKKPKEPIPTQRVVVKDDKKGPGFMDSLVKRFSKANVGESSATEKALLDLYLQVRPSTDRDELTVEDDLILLGTSSIQMGELGSRIKLRFGVGLPPTVMFAPPRSIRSIAASIDDKLERASTDISNAVSSVAADNPEGPPTNPDPPPSQSSTGIVPLLLQGFPSICFKAWGRTCSFTLLMLLFVESHADFCAELKSDYTLFFELLSSCSTFHFLLCIWATHTILSLLLPLLAISLKWIILCGGYKPGVYPLWGQYYLRWWLVTRIVDACGMGPFFKYNNFTRCLYLKMLGAKVSVVGAWAASIGAAAVALVGAGVAAYNGADGLGVCAGAALGAIIGAGLASAAFGYTSVKISPGAQISEWDLVTIGDGVVIDASIVQPFAAQAGTMVLKPINMAQLSGIGVSSVLGPGDSLPYGVVLGPLSCGLEKGNSSLEAVSTHHRKLVRSNFPEPSFFKKWFIGAPCMVFVNVMHALPYISCLFFVLIQFSRVDLDSSGLLPRWADRADWLVDKWRLGALILAITTRSVVSPWFKFFAVALVKHLIIGRFKAGPKGDWEHFQYWLMAKLVAKDGPLCGTHKMLGKHFSGVSWALRLLGANIGKRVFWPGVELKIVEFDLLTVGDDVVFGSRSYVLCGDAETNAPVTLAAGANVADRCVLLPGCVVERNAVLGSGSLAKAGTTYNRGCTAIGSVGGDCVMLHPGKKSSDEQDDDVEYSVLVPGVPDTGGPDTIKPFGKVFYGKGPERAGLCRQNPPAWVFAWYGVFIAAIGPAFRSAVWLCALFTATSMMRFEPVSTSTDPADVAMMQARADPTLGAWMIVKHINLIVSFCLLYQCIALGIAVGLGVSYKWALMGQRKEGSWNWDSSKYNRNWKFYTAVTFIDLGAIGGSAYIVWWYRLLGCKIGKDVCLWPAGSDLYLTEPDLVELDEGVCLNKKAGVVCHLNSRGGFSLTAIRMGARASCRSFCKVTGGSRMGDDSLLLEHTLLMPGEKLGDGETRQGWISLEH